MLCNKTYIKIIFSLNSAYNLFFADSVRHHILPINAKHYSILSSDLILELSPTVPESKLESEEILQHTNNIILKKE